jgi:hypothetical protein
MRRVQRFRNRVAHHDSLLDQDAPARLEDMVAITGWIDPAAQEWLTTRTDALAIGLQMP